MKDPDLDPGSDELAQEVYRLEVLGQIKQAVLVDQSPRSFAETAFAHLEKIVPYDHASVILFDFEKEKGQVLAVRGGVDVGLEPGSAYPITDCVLGPDRLSDPVSLTSELLRPQPSCLMDACLSGMGIRSYISLLLISHNTVIGSLNIASCRQEPFDDAAVRIARDVADSLAVAIQKAMLFEQTRLKAAELEALSKLSFELRREESREQIVGIIRAETESVMKADASAFIWRDGETYHILRGRPGAETSITWNGSEPPGAFFQSLLNLDLPSYASPLFSQLNDALSLPPGIRMSVLMPLKSGDRLVGKLYLGFKDEREFGAEDERLLASIADIAGNALYRANVMGTLEERVASRTRQLETLYNISNTINQTLDLASILDQSLAFLEQALGGTAAVHLFSEQGHALELAAGCRMAETYRVQVQQLAEAAAEQNHLVHREAAEDPSAGSQAFQYIGIPLKGQQQGLGVLSVALPLSVTVSDDAFSLLSGVADHVSIAVENARLRSRAEAAIVIEERQRLARELHDSISQLLYSQLLFSQAGRRAYENGELDLLPLYLNRLDEVAEQAFKEMRLMIYSLRPQLLESVGLVGALQHRLATVERRTGLDAELHARPDLKLPAAIEDSLFRIAQEALNNTLKHASATAVDVWIEEKDTQVVLSITDNGKGFERDRAMEGMGLAGMSERARQFGGQLTVTALPGQGTTIRVEIPMNEPKEAQNGTAHPAADRR